MFFVRIYILFCFHLIIYANRTDTWPPMSAYNKHYDLDYILPTCYERSGVDKKEIIELEMTEDMEHLPDSRELKLFIRCWNELSESVDLKANKALIGKFGELMADFTKEEKEIFIGFNKGCPKRIKHITDPIEWSYALIICFKRNDNKNFYLMY